MRPCFVGENKSITVKIWYYRALKKMGHPVDPSQKPPRNLGRLDWREL